jgi:vancomycin resistance protein VanW
MKRLLPASLRLWLNILLRNWKDIRTGTRNRLIQKTAKRQHWPVCIQLQQAIHVNEYSENKQHNLRLAIENMEGLIIEPGRIFSFWHLTGAPTAARGYKGGRNLVGDVLVIDIGGGLCQLSGIIYQLCLLSGMKIIERYPHSKDIYTDDTRFTPLGTDATVVYGYKDLRVENNYSFPVCFSFKVKDDLLEAAICAHTPLETYTLQHHHSIAGNTNTVTTYRLYNGQQEKVSTDIYVILGE